MCVSRRHTYCLHTDNIEQALKLALNNKRYDSNLSRRNLLKYMINKKKSIRIVKLDVENKVHKGKKSICCQCQC